MKFFAVLLGCALSYSLAGQADPASRAPADGLAAWFPAPVWQMGWLGIALWQWLSMAVALLLAFVVFRLTGWLFQRVIAPVLRRRLNLGEDEPHTFRKISRFLGLWTALFLLQVALPAFRLPGKTSAVLAKGLYILGAFYVIFLVNQVVRLLFYQLQERAENTGSKLDNQFTPILRRLAFSLIWIVGIIYILHYLEVNIAALLAGVSIGGLAIALAAQDTVKNFFGSIMIFVDKPFQIGDVIAFAGGMGVVEEVGVRSTRIRTPANSLTYVPNGMLADQVVDNLGLRMYRQYKTEIGITYDTAPVLIDRFVAGIRQILEEHPFIRKDFIEVHLNSFGANALNILVYTFFNVPDYSNELRGRHEVMQAIIKLADELGIRFAFPTQTLHIEAFPGLHNP